ncbi:hypothetical protein [Treponema parvum]|uniref:hypothetical protein n=1 Tax=Treponema parvum TaxID=138851 RepID=UPI001AEC3920|nr:hypothetical protein [Treponema parvum]
MRYKKKEKLQIYIVDSREEIRRIAREDVSSLIKVLLQTKDEINIMFAAAPSQNEVLENLILDKDIDWTRVNGFHMDEYIGLTADAPQRVWIFAF